MTEKQLDTFFMKTCLPVTEETVHRAHDDHDGDWSQRMGVGLLQNGDALIWTGMQVPLRFRTEEGGTRSPNTYKALLILRKAMALDSAKYPDRPPSFGGQRSPFTPPS